MLPAPNLDDRGFQDFVDDAKRFLQRRLPEWSDHNVSDPGITLLEAVAQMVDQLTYRLNRVPYRNYLAFLDLIGLKPLPATPARAPLTFYLSGSQPETITIPRSTGVATRRGAGEPVVFHTAQELVIPPARFSILATETGGGVTSAMAKLRDSEPVTVFAVTPQPGDAMLVGLDQAAPACVVLVRLTCAVRGVGVDPLDPPLQWEAWTGTGWQRCDLESDGTGALNRAGDVILRLPAEHAMHVVGGEQAGWLRCRYLAPREDQRGFAASPTVSSVAAFTIGGTVDALHAVPIDSEELGIGEGVPGQVLAVARPPLVRTAEPVEILVSDDDGWQSWRVVEHFADSGASERHVRIDATGEVSFGPGVREADGSLRQHGAVPPRGSTIVIRRYWSGGGRAGNVATGSLTVLRTPMPYLDTVVNHRAAVGGVDGETVEDAVARGPMFLRTLDRAVTAEDYEELARRAAPHAARVRCVPATGPEDAGGVRVLVVPSVRPLGRLGFAELAPDEDLLETIRVYLDARRPLGTRLIVEPPHYLGLTVVARIVTRPGVEPEGLRARSLDALYEFFDPIHGGPEGTGWPFGRPVHMGQVYALLLRVPGTELVEDVKLFPADLATGRRTAETTRMALAPNELVFGYDHQIRVEPGSRS